MLVQPALRIVSETSNKGRIRIIGRFLTLKAAPRESQPHRVHGVPGTGFAAIVVHPLSQRRTRMKPTATVIALSCLLAACATALSHPQPSPTQDTQDPRDV